MPHAETARPAPRLRGRRRPGPPWHRVLPPLASALLLASACTAPNPAYRPGSAGRAGEPCDDTAPCATGLVCTAGTCRRPPPGRDARPPRRDGALRPDLAPPRDRDGDGLADILEDRNGDGFVGCCRKTCGQAIAGCPAVKAGQCAPGQRCVKGACTPAAHLLCARGESDPGKRDTFGTPGGDKGLRNTLCTRRGAGNPAGRPPVTLSESRDGDWTLAADPALGHTALTIKGRRAMEAAATLDDRTTGGAVAGFVLSIKGDARTAASASSKLLALLKATPPGGSGASARVRTSGATIRTHDGFDARAGAIVDITAPARPTLSGVRDGALRLILGRTAADITGLPAPFGGSSDRFVLRYGLVLRPDGRAIVTGAVTRRLADNDPARPTRHRAEDLAGLSGLARAGKRASLLAACRSFPTVDTRLVDAIWVIDETDSMLKGGYLDRLAAAVPAFLSAAASAGLDLRVGVTGVYRPSRSQPAGKLCGRVPRSRSDPADPDTFLLPGARGTIVACVKNPPYFEKGNEYGLANVRGAIERHLPRASGSAGRFRPGARLAVIVASEEVSQELKAGTTYEGKHGFLTPFHYNGGQKPRTCTLPALVAGTMATYLDPWIKLLTGKDPRLGASARATFFVIGGPCGDTDCKAMEVPHGYLELVKATGGKAFPLCKKDLAPAARAIAAALAPRDRYLLDTTPVAASLAVAVGGKLVPRSRADGFVYSPGPRSITFTGKSFPQQGQPVIVSFDRWRD